MTVDMMEALKNNNEEGLQIATDKLVGKHDQKRLGNRRGKRFVQRSKKKFGFEINDVKKPCPKFCPGSGVGKSCSHTEHDTEI